MSSADKGEFEEALQSYSRFIEQKSLDKRRRPGKNFVNPDSRQFPVKSECVFSTFGTFSEGKFLDKAVLSLAVLEGKGEHLGLLFTSVFLTFEGESTLYTFFDIFCK